MKNIYLLIGRSGSGKTTAAEILEKKYGLKSVQSYTTRPKRYENETGHIFISKNEFDKLDLIAYTKFNGYEYGVTKDIINNSDLYVIDIAGVKTLKQNHFDKPIITIYFKCDKNELISRMIARKDSTQNIIKRLENDDIMFKEETSYPFDYVINANKSITEVVDEIYKIIKGEEK